MKKHDFYYDLPNELIAQTPIEPRDASRMMVVNRQTGEIEHKHFYDVVDYLNPGDCLILNDTKVLPARLYGIKDETGAKVEFLLLMQKEKDVWEVITGPGKKAKTGSKFTFNDGILYAEITAVLDNGDRIAKFTYAKELGSAAAPTAGLHFTPEVLQKIKDKGVKIGYVTLHVGIGTFRPVKTENIEEHKMHSEHYHLPKETADLINETHHNGGRVVAVGTTCCRTLESVATYCGEICEKDDWTSIFIYPGYKFKCIDALITNFHLPESTLIMLVSAFYNREDVLRAYEEAVKEKYRFFSFGDCMLIV